MRVSPAVRAVALILLVSSATAHAQVISDPLRLSPIDLRQSDPALAAWGSHVVGVWYSQIFFHGSTWAHSSDGGLTWTPQSFFPGVDPSTHFIEGQHPMVIADEAGGFLAAVRSKSSPSGSGISVYRADVSGANLVWQGPAIVGAIGHQFDSEAPWVAADPLSGHVYLVYSRINNGIFPPTYGIEFSRSIDGGATFESPVLMGGTNSIQPRVARGVDGSVHLFWLDRASGSLMSRRSDDHGASFGVPQVVAPFHDDGRGNPLNTLAVGVDRGQGPRHGAIYVTWSEQMDGTFDPLTIVYEVEPNDVFAQATRVELGQEILGQMLRDDVKFSIGDQDYLYFDGTAGTTVQIETELTDVSPEPPYVLTMSLRLLCGEETTSLRTILDLGLARAQDIPPVPRTVTLPRTGRFWLHSAGSSIYPHVYHIRLRELVARPWSASRDHRDIVLVHSMDGGATWSPKKRVNDCAPGDDDSLPELVVDDLGQVHVAWYCKRDEIDGCSTLTHTFWTVSSDGGTTFRPALRASTSESPWDCPVDGLRIGRHLGLAASGGRVHIAWTEVGCPDSVDIYTARIEDVATGVAIGRFDGVWRENAVRLAWQVSDGRGIAGFRLHRARGDGAFEPIGAAIAYRGAIAYEQADDSAIPGATYRYRLEVLREDGPSTWEGPITITLPSIPRTLSWSAPIPNPFRETVTLELAVPVRSEVRVRIYDVQGHEVARLHEGALDSGTHRISWSGLNRRGREVAPGVYLVRAEGGGERSVMRVLRIR